MNRAYRVALICGAFPLLVGVSIFLLWLITRWDWLMMAGIFTLYGGGCEADFGTIPPGGVVRRTFWIQHDGALEFRAVSGATTHSKTIDGYVTNSMGGHTNCGTQKAGYMDGGECLLFGTPKQEADPRCMGHPAAMSNW